MFRNFFTKVFPLFAVLGLVPVHAEKTVLVERDSANPYQMNPHAHVRRVIHYEYSLGGNAHVNSRNSLARLAQQYGFRLERWTALSDMTAANLADSAGVPAVTVAVFSQGAGDVLGGVGSPQVNAMRNFVEVQGKGMLMLHEAASYIPCPNIGGENLADTNCRWLARVAVRQYLGHATTDGTRMRVYADSTVIGQIPSHATGDAAVAAAINHGRKNVETRMIFEDLPRNGVASNPGQPYVWDGVGDEVFVFRGFPRQQGAQVLDGVAFGPVNILLSLDPTTFTNSYAGAGNGDMQGDHSLSWTRKVGNGNGAVHIGGHSNVYARARTGNALGADTVRDSLPEKYMWRLARYLARDFVGCMDPSYAEYNPEASVQVLSPGFDDPAPCKTVVSLRPRVATERAGISSEAKVIRVTLAADGTHAVRVTDVQGRSVFSAVVSGDRDPLRIAGLQPGLYFVRVESPDGAKTVERIRLF